MGGIPLRFSAPFLSNFRIVETAGRSHNGSCFAAVFLRLFSGADILIIGTIHTKLYIQGDNQR